MSTPTAPACYEKRRYGQAVLWLAHSILWTVNFALRIGRGMNDTLYLVMAALCAVFGFVDVLIYLRYHLRVADQGVLLCDGLRTYSLLWTEVTRMELRRGRFLSSDVISLYSADNPDKPLLRLALEDELESVVRQYAPVPIEEIA